MSGGWKHQHATPMRSFALLRAVVDDARFRTLGAPAQVAILAAVIRFADHNGRWYLKAETLADVVGRQERRVRDAIDQCVAAGMLLRSRRRRPDGTLSVYEFELDDVIINQADETVRLWTETSAGSSKPSAGASADETVRLPSPDETVRARTALNGSTNGVAAGGSADAAGDAHRAFWLENIGIEYVHDPRAFAEEATAALRIDALSAETLRVALVAATSANAQPPAIAGRKELI